MKGLRLAITGFVSMQAGSVASANALLLRGLLDRGCEVVFFSKSSFVDPRPVVGDHARFRFVEVDNRLADRTRAALEKIPIAGMLASQADAASYNRLLVQKIDDANREENFDLCLWLGDFARGAVPSVRTVSFVQGPPGTDARSILDRFAEIKKLAGPLQAWKWRLAAQVKLSPRGLPPLCLTDQFIVGSRQSAGTLRRLYGIPEEKISALPYPIDLHLFDLPPTAVRGEGALRCLWLGRVVPRKRLDLFLNGAAEAIRRGGDVRLTIVGGIGFVPGYEKLIKEFPFPDRLTWEKSVPRENVPALLHAHDVLIQPSDEENFGSSVAEAQACGLPVIIGATNGNADYLCSRDIRLRDDQSSTLADALAEMARRKAGGQRGEPQESRNCAVRYFHLERVTDGLMEILQETAAA